MEKTRYLAVGMIILLLYHQTVTSSAKHVLDTGKSSDIQLNIPEKGIQYFEEDYVSFLKCTIGDPDIGKIKEKDMKNIKIGVPYIVYVSSGDQDPIYYWLATDNKVNEVRVDLLVFSKDLKKSATYSLLYEDGKNPTGSISDTEENTFEILKEHKKTKYIFIENGPSMLLLNAKNEILNDIGYRPKVTVKGDYYHALDYKTLAVSYQDLTSEKNLVKFKLKVKGDKVIDLIH